MVTVCPALTLTVLLTETCLDGNCISTLWLPALYSRVMVVLPIRLESIKTVAHGLALTVMLPLPPAAVALLLLPEEAADFFELFVGDLG